MAVKSRGKEETRRTRRIRTKHLFKGEDFEVIIVKILGTFRLLFGSDFH